MSPGHNISILFVDDERSVLNALRRNLLRDSFESLFAQSGAEALAMLAERPVDILVADLRMPEMDGIALLETVRRKYPDIVRLVLSASSDVDRILDTINKGEVFRFIVKPINDLDAFRRTIGQAMAQVLLERRAKEADRLKAEFLASITHELKSPLAAIKGFAGAVLRDREMDDATRNVFLCMAVSECDRLMQLISSVLDISRIEAGSFALHLKPTDLGLLIEETADSMRPAFAAGKVTLKTEIPGDTPDVRGDRDRLIQVFRNLLDNALKFTPEGGEIRVSLSKTGNGLIARVEDTGRGIDPDELPRICEKFFRGRRAGARIGGAGLGLAVAREILDRHGWGLTFESEPGEGTTVTVTTRGVAHDE